MRDSGDSAIAGGGTHPRGLVTSAAGGFHFVFIEGLMGEAIHLIFGEKAPSACKSHQFLDENGKIRGQIQITKDYFSWVCRGQ